MTFDPTFRFYRDDPQHRAHATLTEIWHEVDAELQRRRASYPALLAKGRLSRDEHDRELRVWSALRDRYRCRPLGDLDLATATDAEILRIPMPAATGAVATWTEMIHALRREIALRRQRYPALVAAGKLTPDAAREKLELIEHCHSMNWRWTWHDEAVAAREATERRAAA